MHCCATATTVPIEIDNSAAERALRGVAIGRRNYLFDGADSGGERVAAIYLLIGRPKLNGVAPEAWLRRVLTHIADHPSIGLMISCLGTATSQQPIELTPLPSGVMTSSTNFPQRPTRR